eukprot:8119359-Pyramimonas_sp.AAC.1
MGTARDGDAWGPGPGQRVAPKSGGPEPAVRHARPTLLTVMGLDNPRRPRMARRSLPGVPGGHLGAPERVKARRTNNF